MRDTPEARNQRLQEMTTVTAAEMYTRASEARENGLDDQDIEEGVLATTTALELFGRGAMLTAASKGDDPDLVEELLNELIDRVWNIPADQLLDLIYVMCLSGGRMLYDLGMAEEGGEG